MLWSPAGATSVQACDGLHLLESRSLAPECLPFPSAQAAPPIKLLMKGQQEAWTEAPSSTDRLASCLWADAVGTVNRIASRGALSVLHGALARRVTRRSKMRPSCPARTWLASTRRHLVQHSDSACGTVPASS
jgi:hypothetical protein